MGLCIEGCEAFKSPAVAGSGFFGYGRTLREPDSTQSKDVTPMGEVLLVLWTIATETRTARPSGYAREGQEFTLLEFRI